MEFFNERRAVKLRSHHDKYLVSNDDGESVRQSRNGSTLKAWWVVEPVDDNPKAIRLKSVQYGNYLTASSSKFLLGATDKQVIQTQPDDPSNRSIEWAPVLDGFQVRLVTASGGTCLRANEGMPPWNNSVTHDVLSAKWSWTLWKVEAVEITENKEQLTDDLFGSEVGSPVSLHSNNSPMESKTRSGMKLFCNAKVVRLRSNHNKYLYAKNDRKSVTQDKSDESKNVHWAIEFSSESENVIRLKSCYGKYLTASNKLFLSGWTGRKVLQADRLDSSVGWELIGEGNQVKLKTRNGNFLRANFGIPPWRDSVTHDVPNRTATQYWIFWDVEVVETMLLESPQPEPGVQLESFESSSSSESNHRDKDPSFGREEEALGYVGVSLFDLLQLTTRGATRDTT